MDEETKKVAQEKANAMNERIGYPEILTNSVELSKEYQNVCFIENQFSVFFFILVFTAAPSI